METMRELSNLIRFERLVKAGEQDDLQVLLTEQILQQNAELNIFVRKQMERRCKLLRQLIEVEILVHQWVGRGDISDLLDAAFTARQAILPHIRALDSTLNQALAA